MHIKIKFLTFLLLFLILNFHSKNLFAQELNCKVAIDFSQIETTERQIFESLERSIQDFMNNNIWTEEKFQVNEKIDCFLSLTIDSWNASEHRFEGKLQITSARPVYNSNYTSPMINHLDNDIVITYIEHQSLDYVDGVFTSNLTSILAFYAYIIIGMDFDSFSETGGTPYFRKAENIVSSAQGSGSSGWSPMERGSRNRHFIANNLMDERLNDFRKAVYKYHRHGLDVLSTDVEKGRIKILESLEEIHQANRARPNSRIMQIFFYAKFNEISNIFAQAPSSEKRKALEILEVLDIRNASRYREHLR